MLGKNKRQQRPQGYSVELFRSGRPTVTSGEAAEILGISRWTLLRRLNRGIYSHVEHYERRNRRIFSMEDIIRVAYPTADDAQVTMLMKEYREKFLAARRRRKPKKSYDISDFLSQLRKASEAGGNIVIYRKTDAQEDPSLIAEITLAKALGGRIRLEGAVLDELGDGVYTVNIHGKDKEVLGEYEFAVGSLPETDTEKVEDVSTDPLLQVFFDGQQKMEELLIDLIQGQYDEEYDDEYDDE